MDLIGDLITGLQGALGPLLAPPLSMLFIMVVSLSLAILSTYVTIKLTDIEEVSAKMELVKEYDAKLRQARRTMDPILLQEVMDSQQRIMRIQSEVAMARMKPSCLFYIPFLIIFWLLSSLFGASVVAVIPFNIHKMFPFFVGWLGVPVEGGFGVYFWVWYIMTSISIGGFIRKFANMGALASPM